MTPQSAPELFAKPVKDAKQEFEVPDQLREIFSLEEITSMEEEDFDALVDQMDLESEGKAAIGTEVMSSADLDKLDDI